jgi:alpha-methylacyl-CoA racemase
MSEVHEHPQIIARSSFTRIDGVIHPMPAPRFSATPAATPVDQQPALMQAWGLK